MKKFTIIRRLLLVFLGLALGLTLYYANAQNILGNQLPMPFGVGIANVLSGSMEPAFSKGTLLVVKETDQVEKGDIAVYQQENSLVVHRVVDVQKNQIITRGDANNTADPPIGKNQLKGVVIFKIPYLGTVLSVLKTPVGMILLLILAILLIEGSFRKQKEVDEKELDDIKAEIRRLKEEQKTKNAQKMREAEKVQKTKEEQE